MAPGEFRELDRIVAALGAKIDAFQAHWQKQDDRATEGRKFLYDKFDELGNDFQAVRYEVRDLSKDMNSIKPKVEILESIRLEAKGAVRVARFGWLIVGAIGASVPWIVGHWTTIEHLGR